MKNLKHIMIVTAIATSGFLFMACEKEDEMSLAPSAIEKNSIAADGNNISIGDFEPETTVVDLIVKNEKFTILEEAVIYAGLAETLATLENVTVFAPTDEAFRAFMRENNFRQLEDIPMDVLTSVLLYHTIGEKVFSRNLEAGYISTMSNSNTGFAVSLFAIPSKGLLNGSTNIIDVDMAAKNGVVHTSDNVLMPPTVVNHALNNRQFSVLVDAIVKAGLVDALNSDGPFTVFAPVNEAFYELFTTMGIESINEIPRETLTQVLLSHVVIGNITSQIIQPGYLETLNPNKRMEIDIPECGVTVDGEIHIILPDVQGSNGIIHAIDGVILPANPSAERDFADM